MFTEHLYDTDWCRPFTCVVRLKSHHHPPKQELFSFYSGGNKGQRAGVTRLSAESLRGSIVGVEISRILPRRTGKTNGSRVEPSASETDFPLPGEKETLTKHAVRRHLFPPTRERQDLGTE